MVQHLPGVGQNLQDHLEVYIQYSCKQPVSLNPSLAFWKRPFIGAQWLFLRSGPGATNHFEAGGFIRSNDDVEYPNLMYHFLPIAVRYDGTSPAGGHGYQVHVGPMYSDARGSVTIKSTDPREHPAIVCNYLSTEQDRREWVEAIRLSREILNQPALEPYNGGELSPGDAVKTDEEILDWVGREGETALHPSCTCRMGIDDHSVIDPLTMRVHGTQGLRVVDASVMPYVTNGNIYAPVMMLAEKAADLILGNSRSPNTPSSTGTRLSARPEGTAGHPRPRRSRPPTTRTMPTIWFATSRSLKTITDNVTAINGNTALEASTIELSPRSEPTENVTTPRMSAAPARSATHSPEPGAPGPAHS